MKCPNFATSRIENLEYKKNDLVRFFTEYSECYNKELINFESKQKRDLFNLTIRPRLNISSIKLPSVILNSRSIDFRNKTGFGFGLEAEFILPFNKNKWAITIEPTYQSLKAEKTTETNLNNVSGGVLITNVDYNSIEVPLGLRPMAS